MKKTLMSIAIVCIALVFIAGCKDPVEPEFLCINTVNADPFTCEPGDTVEVTLAYSYEGDATVDITWESDFGEIIETTEPEVIYWVAPAMPDWYIVDVIVSDGEYQSTGHVTIEVGECTVPTTDGLLAYYPFNDCSTEDIVGSYDGVNLGATCYSRCHSMDAFYFDNDDYTDTLRIRLADANGHNGGTAFDALTISLWFEASTNDTSSYIYRLASQDGRGHIHVDEDSVYFKLRESSSSHGVISYPIDNDIWYHIVCLWDGSVMEMYIDGDLVSEIPFSGPLSTNDEGNTLGANYTPPLGDPDHICTFNGAIDEVRIYNRALSEPEIMCLYRFDCCD